MVEIFIGNDVNLACIVIKVSEIAFKKIISLTGHNGCKKNMFVKYFVKIYRLMSCLKCKHP